MSAQPCVVTRLRMHAFRNYAETTVNLGPALNVLTGRNAQGKTNLLEAVATLALTRSPRAAAAADLIQWGAAGCQLEADIERPDGLTRLAARFERTTGSLSRRATVDGKPRTARAILGVCPVVLFWPDDLHLVKAGPDGRRRLLDVLLSQLEPRVTVHLLRYRRVLEQRNALLHRLRLDGGPLQALDAFSRELAHHGARVVVARRRLLAELAPLAADALAGLSKGAEQLELTYASTAGNVADDDDAAEVALLEALRERGPEELARATTVVGPHRDDIDIALNGRAARHTASQGQQRSIVLACKIAEMGHVAAVTGMTPVVLLDDVVSELDDVRRRDLMDALAQTPQQQVLLTSTEPLSGTGAFAAVRQFHVEQGTITVTGT